MKKIDLGQTITILANVGVIAGIVFLGFELRQNNEILLANSRVALGVGDLGLLDRVIGNPRLWINLANSEMTDEEKVQLSAYLISFLRNYELSWFQYQSGALDEQTWSSNQSAIVDMLSYSESRKWWQSFREFDFDAEFAAHVDGLLKDEPLRTSITDIRAFD